MANNPPNATPATSPHQFFSMPYTWSLRSSPSACSMSESDLSRLVSPSTEIAHPSLLVSLRVHRAVLDTVKNPPDKPPRSTLPWSLRSSPSARSLSQSALSGLVSSLSHKPDKTPTPTPCPYFSSPDTWSLQSSAAGRSMSPSDLSLFLSSPSPEMAHPSSRLPRPVPLRVRRATSWSQHMSNDRPAVTSSRPSETWSFRSSPSTCSLSRSDLSLMVSPSPPKIAHPSSRLPRPLPSGVCRATSWSRRLSNDRPVTPRCPADVCSSSQADVSVCVSLPSDTTDKDGGTAFVHYSAFVVLVYAKKNSVHDYSQR